MEQQMKMTDLAGLSHFEEHFRELKDQYVIVGGFATLMLLDRELPNHGKATYDIDLVLLTSTSVEMTDKIKTYVREGGYTIQKGQDSRYQYYRFVDPKIEGYAKEIELFAAEEYGIELDEEQHIIPIDPNEGLYSLSAIMLDHDYFNMIKNNIEEIDGIPYSNTLATMLLKMSAVYDLYHRGEDKWKKHRRDILKLTLLLTGEERLVLTGRMIEDVTFFKAEIEKLTPKVIRQIVGKSIAVDKDAITHSIEQVFVIDAPK